MAGYLFLIGGDTDEQAYENLKHCIQTGVYSTYIKPPKEKNWRPEVASTFADYLGMRAGDNVYFFSKRKVYGVGTLVDIDNACKYKNFPDASEAMVYNYEDIKEDLLYDTDTGSQHNRWLCVFKPYPAFFKTGVDMDELLQSAPEKIRIIRTMQGVSFIKMDDEENKAIRDFIVYKNKDSINDETMHFPVIDDVHHRIKRKLSQKYSLKASDVMDQRATPTGILDHEMALECGVLELLMDDDSTNEVLGNWKYVSHQVIASPFKPLAYVSKMDIFGYRHISGLPVGYDSSVSDYMVIELKARKATADCVEQLLRYVEWIKQEYAYGDYSRIKAFLIAKSYDQTAIDAQKTSAVRYYTQGGRSPKTATWAELRFIKYRYDKASRKLLLEPVEL